MDTSSYLHREKENTMKRQLTALLLIVVLLTGCSASPKPASPSFSNDMAGSPESMEREEQGIMVDDAYNSPEESYGQTGNAAAVERIVIKNASLSIVVKDPANALTEISQMADGMGGFVVNSRLYKTYIANGVKVPAAEISIRVPAAQLTIALDQIKSLVDNLETDIQNENVSGEDVTKNYTNSKSRLRNLEDAEAQLREIMASADETEDVLSVFNQLTQVREEIEVLQGEINYYEESARLSAISVSIVSQASIQPLTIGGWEPVGVARDALQALINGLQFLVNFLIWIILFVAPIFLLITIPIYLIVRAVLRGRKNRKVKKDASPSETIKP